MEKPTQADAEAAVRVLIEWAGDDPNREGLIDTPGWVARSYRELFAGYTPDPRGNAHARNAGQSGQVRIASTTGIEISMRANSDGSDIEKRGALNPYRQSDST